MVILIQAINSHRDKKLLEYLLNCKSWFENDEILDLKVPDFVWSSGWTKVYSFMFSKTTIYDSRVAAFINYVMIVIFYQLKKEHERVALKSVTNKLISFSGVTNRKRYVSKSDRKLLGIKMKSDNHLNSFIANKVASWILRYIAEIEFSSRNQHEFRQIDKAAFMLGFDIYQVDKNVNFV